MFRLSVAISEDSGLTNNTRHSPSAVYRALLLAAVAILSGCIAPEDDVSVTEGPLTIQTQSHLATSKHCLGTYTFPNTIFGQYFDLGWVPAGARIRVSTLPNGCNGSVSSGDTQIRVYNKDNTQQLAYNNDYAAPTNVLSDLWYTVGTNAGGYDKRGARIQISGSCFVAPCTGNVFVEVKQLHEASLETPSLVAGTPGLYPAEYDLSGRLNHLPVSAFYSRKGYQAPGLDPTLGATHKFAIKATCSANDDAAVYVKVQDNNGVFIAGYFNNDSSMSSKDPYFETPVLYPNTYSYDIYVFSLKRATANCQIFYKKYEGSWTSEIPIASCGALSSCENPMNVGGTLLRVGAFVGADRVEIMTPDDGVSIASNTQMLVFDLGTNASGCVYGGRSFACASDNAPLFNNDRAFPTDFDAAVTNNLQGCPPPPAVCPPQSFTQSNNNYALIGKQSRSTSSNQGVETRADVIHTPLEPYSSYIATAIVGGFTGSAASSVPVGRYQAYIYTSLNRPVGSTTDGTHNSKLMPGCKIDNGNNVTDVRFNRGQQNDVAFELNLEYSIDGGVNWLPKLKRFIPRALFGATDNQRFLLEFEQTPATSTHRWRLTANNAVTGVTFLTSWYLLRNPDTHTLKVVTNNIGKECHFSWALRELENLADLTAVRGSIDKTNLLVKDADDQGPWEWDADIVVTQEMETSGTDSCSSTPGHNLGPDYGVYDAPWLFKAEAEARDSQLWSFVVGRDERYNVHPGTGSDCGGDHPYYTDWPACQDGGEGAGVGAVFVRQDAWPDRTLRKSILFQYSNGLSYGQCSVSGVTNLTWESGTSSVESCNIGHKDWNGAWTVEAHAIPGKAAVRRNVGTSSVTGRVDRPIAIFNAHLSSDDDSHTETGSYKGTRAEQWDYLVDVIKNYMIVSPGSFNKNGSVDPRNIGNRFIIAGDFNDFKNECGEHYWFLKKLRDHFGYAVDVSMAADGAPGNRFAMGDSGQGWETEGFFDSYYGFMYDMPLDFTSYWQTFTSNTSHTVYAWSDLANPSGYRTTAINGTDNYPWWARTVRGFANDSITGGGGERYDAIVLVGKGWAYDDPVMTYTRMWDSHDTSSPMSWNGNCVEPYQNHVDPAEPWTTTGSGTAGACTDPAKSYRPNRWLGSELITPVAGDAAIQADHLPVGVKLRVWSGTWGR